jgi:hypothetical protein
MISKMTESGHFYGVKKNSSNTNVLLQVTNLDLSHDQVRIRLTPDEARTLSLLLNKHADEVDSLKNDSTSEERLGQQIVKRLKKFTETLSNDQQEQ